MKKLVFLLLALLVAVPVMAQLPGNIPVPDCYRMGKVLCTIAATDTIHFTDTNPLLEATAADRWQGYETVYVPYNGGLIDKRAYVTGAVFFADKPFALKPTYRNGDAVTIPILCDTVFSSTPIGSSANINADKFPVYQTIKGDLSKVIVTLLADTVYCVPLLDWDVK